MRAEVAQLDVEGPPELISALELGLEDVRDAGNVIGDFDLTTAYELGVRVELADPEAA
jgi:hypothetical protein